MILFTIYGEPVYLFFFEIGNMFILKIFVTGLSFFKSTVENNERISGLEIIFEDNQHEKERCRKLDI